MILRIALTLSFIFIWAGVAGAQATQPVSVEQRALKQTSLSTVQTLPQNSSTAGGDLLGTRQLFVGLLIVLSLIFAAKWLLPRVWPAVGTQRHSAVRVLGRTPISPKNQVVLVQVGQRVLVLGENANQLTTLSNIDNADEVAMLIGKANSRIDRDAERPSPFATALDQSNRVYGSTDVADANAEEPAPSNSGELSELISKVRGLARQIGRP